MNNEIFIFNKSYAKPYNINYISPNGIIYFKRGKRASWKLKDVREIKNELPSFENFNSKIFQEIRNKFHTKFSDEITGRIIYNIYKGTFDDFL